MPPPVVPDTTSPAALQEASILQGIGEYELPRTTLVKLAKGSVRWFPRAYEGSRGWAEASACAMVMYEQGTGPDAQLPDNVKMQQEVNTVLLRSSTVFINYLGTSRLLTTSQIRFLPLMDCICREAHGVSRSSGARTTLYRAAGQ